MEAAKVPGLFAIGEAVDVTGWPGGVAGHVGDSYVTVPIFRAMEAAKVPGLFAIREAVDVTGWLGGYHFQWAWASGAAAGEGVAAR